MTSNIRTQPDQLCTAASRRTFLGAAGSLGALTLLGSGGLLAQTGAALAQNTSGIVFPLLHGPYQNNGASPWYAEIPLGTPGQPLKFALDSGSNFIWVTSTLCAPDQCLHYGGGRFDYNASNSFSWIDQTPTNVSFGPWGTMVIETGHDVYRDVITVPSGQTLPTNLYLAQNYSGAQFEQLDWDGGIGLPSGSAYAQPGVSFIMQDLLDVGAIDPALPFMSFETDMATGQGTCLLGGYDESRFDPNSGIFMPWTPYTKYPGVEYIWTTPLASYAINGKNIGSNLLFCLDLGSSCFKGDDAVMNATLAAIGALPNKPTITLQVGSTSSGGFGTLNIGPDIYEMLIQAGPDQGKTLPQFTPLGLDGLVLVGSLVMDWVYTIYEYEVTRNGNLYSLSPIGMWIFNKTNGPRVITHNKGRKWSPGRRKTLLGVSPHHLF